MHARMISLITTPGKREAVCRVIEKDIFPLVNAQPGFVEHMTLISEQEPRLVTVVSLWQTKFAEEHSRKDVFPTVLEYLNPLLAAQPAVSSFQCFSVKGTIQPLEKANVITMPGTERKIEAV